MTLHPSADAELKEAAQYYESREPGLGSDFLGEIERALDQILTNPAEVLMAVPLQCYVRSLSGTNTNPRLRPPEAATFLLAQAPKELRRMSKTLLGPQD